MLFFPRGSLRLDLSVVRAFNSCFGLEGSDGQLAPEADIDCQRLSSHCKRRQDVRPEKASSLLHVANIQDITRSFHRKPRIAASKQ